MKKFKGISYNEILEKILFNQELQGNPRSLNAFKKDFEIGRISGGFNWVDTPEGAQFWSQVFQDYDFTIFFAKLLDDEN
jgi:hypothetical protein